MRIGNIEVAVWKLVMSAAFLSSCAIGANTASCSGESTSTQEDSDFKIEYCSEIDLSPYRDWLNLIRATEQQLFDVYKEKVTSKTSVVCQVTCKFERGHFKQIKLAKSSGNRKIDDFSMSAVQALESDRILSKIPNSLKDSFDIFVQFRFPKTTHLEISLSTKKVATNCQSFAFSKGGRSDDPQWRLNALVRIQG